MAPVDGSGGLSAGAWLDLDLLRQRRERFGLERSKVIPVRELLWRGGLIGAVLPLVLLVVVLFLVVQDRHLAHRQKRLEPIAAEHDRVDQALIEATKMLEKSRSTNSAIAKAMADVRSSSAVLAEVLTHKNKIKKAKTLRNCMSNPYFFSPRKQLVSLLGSGVFCAVFNRQKVTKRRAICML